MKHTFTLLLWIVMLGGSIASAQAQSNIISIKWTAGQPSPELVYASPTAAGARQAADNCPTTLGLEFSSTTACTGTVLAVTSATQFNRCGIDDNTPTKIELSDASGSFANPTVLVTLAGESQALRFIYFSGVSLPASLPAGTGYTVRMNNASHGPTNGVGPITVKVSPSVSITPSTTAVCAGQSAQLTASGAASYIWNNQQTTPIISATATGSYSVTGIASNGCSNAATANVTVYSNQPVVITSQSQSVTSVCGAGNTGEFSVRFQGSDPISASLFRDNVQLLNRTVSGAIGVSFGAVSLQNGNYQIVLANGCNSVTTNFTPITVNPLPQVAITGLASTYCKDAAPVTLTGSPASGSFTIDGSSATQLNPAALTVGTHTVVYSYTNNNGCSNTASQVVTINGVPNAPVIATRDGQSNVSADLNTDNVTLLISSCAGTINWAGPNNTSGSSSSIMVSTNQVGSFVYQTTCTTNGCTSPAASATVTVGARLTVLHRDVDNYADNNAIQPLLVLQNNSTGSLPLSRVTLRYYVTVEGEGALGNLSMNYAQIGNQNVRLRYVALNPSQQGASGYVEYSFTEGAGSLAAGANSGPIQSYFTKSDYGPLNELDDYSYNPVRNQLTGNLRITAYYDGVLIAGLEPGSTAQIRAVRALTESKNGPDATQINTYLEVRNEGNVAINYSDLRARYYFTSDGNERLQVEVDEGNVSARLVKLPAAVNGADTYLELTFNQGGQLAPGASTGTIRYRISKPDGGRFNQSNDYSYQEQPQDRSQNSRVVVLAGNQVVWGTPPTGASARLAYAEAGSSLSVKVLGNPVQNDQVTFEVTGAGGQPLQLQLLTSQGRVISQQQVPSAEATQRHQLSVAGQAGGLFLLQVSTPTQRQTVKVIKAN